MKPFASLLGALILATGTAQAGSYNSGNADFDMPADPIVAKNPVQVTAGTIMSSKELNRAGLSAYAKLTVSELSAPGERSTYTR